MDKKKKEELALEVFSIIEEEIYYVEHEGILGLSRAANKIADWIENWLEGPKGV